MSNRPAPITTTPAHWNLPCANSHAAQMLISNPRNVSTFGWIFDSASQRTMRSMIAPKNLPIPPVNVMSFAAVAVVNRGELENLQLLDAAGTLYFHLIADLLIQQRASDGRGGGDLAVRRVGLFAG